MEKDLIALCENAVELLNSARKKAYQEINFIMVETYWKIGQRIVETEQDGNLRAKYGSKIIENLSKYLSSIFGRGFSEANLQNMRNFYLTFPNLSLDVPKNLSWSHISRIIRIDNKDERDYYLSEAANQNWTFRQLERNIKTKYYYRILSNQKPHKDNQSLPVPSTSSNTKEFIKDPYILEFLDLPENIEGKESTLESALISNLKQFLLELGKGFSFVGEQFRISTETDHFFVDLVFYNYLLKCFVLIDLKTTKLSHADIGQMDMYVRMFDELKKGKEDNPTIGLILCTDKSETMVKYSVLNENKQIFASKYKTVLPSEEELANMISIETNKLL
ncbi:Predicted nuclease of restriction endonuclease-like (RecB) superfamily, DUF1016 family, partial [Succinivibrio dextrinosolvens]